jgi:hypothetical protein
MPNEDVNYLFVIGETLCRLTQSKKKCPSEDSAKNRFFLYYTNARAIAEHGKE